jgi:hypothetical protein
VECLVQVIADYDTTPFERIMRPILSHTDILVDAPRRIDQPACPSEPLGDSADHAVLVDLSVDPYDCRTYPNFTKGIEGIPQGNLDQYIFAPDDPAYDSIPECISTTHRRYAISCYSWPGIHPRECMEVYGHQLRPLMRKLIEKGGVDNINPNGSFFERAISKAKLSTCCKIRQRRPNNIFNKSIVQGSAFLGSYQRPGILQWRALTASRMMKEAGERRVYLPDFIQFLAGEGACIYLE